MSKPIKVQVDEEDILSALKVRGVNDSLVAQLRVELSKKPNHSKAGYLDINPYQNNVYITRVEVETL